MSELGADTTALVPDAEPQLPTYRSVAAFLERKTGSGIKLFGWTLARTVLIAPPMWAVGKALGERVDGFSPITWKQAFFTAGLASVLISSLAVFRVGKAEGEFTNAYFKARAARPKVIKPPRGMKRIA